MEKGGIIFTDRETVDRNLRPILSNKNFQVDLYEIGMTDSI